MPSVLIADDAAFMRMMLKIRAGDPSARVLEAVQKALA